MFEGFVMTGIHLIDALFVRPHMFARDQPERPWQFDFDVQK
jgi:hypothetical protein